MSYILTPGIPTPVSVANGGTGVSAAAGDLGNLLVPRPNIPLPDPDPAALKLAVDQIIDTLLQVGVIS